MFRSSIEKRLSDISTELQVARREIGVIDEQLLHFADEADDARLRALVSETPLAAREATDAARTAAALRKDRDAKAARVSKLETKQDELLDELSKRTSMNKRAET